LRRRLNISQLAILAREPLKLQPRPARLTTEDGDVVGMNTWSKTGAQNLNFAISAPEIRQLLPGDAVVSIALDKLPAPRRDGANPAVATSGEKTLAYTRGERSEKSRKLRLLPRERRSNWSVTGRERSVTGAVTSS